MYKEIKNANNIKIDFAKEDYEIGEYCIALALIKSLYKKEKISNEIMKEVEQIYEKSIAYC